MLNTTPMIVPHQSKFNELEIWKSYKDSVFKLLLVLSIIMAITQYFPIEDMATLVKICELLNWILIPAFFLLEIYCDRIFMAAEDIRRNAFIDDSFGSKLAGLEPKDYFSNNELSPGFYKAAVNTFQSCNMTYKIIEVMWKSKLRVNIIFIVVFMIMAFWGAYKNTLVLPLMQGLISTYFLKDLIDTYTCQSRFRNILKQFKSYFNSRIGVVGALTNVPECLNLIFDYETTLAFNKCQLDTNIYKKLRDTINQEWEMLKNYYQI